MPTRTPADEREFDEERVTGRPRSRNVQRHTLKSLGIDVGGKTVDTTWLPLVASEYGVPVLDVDRLAAEMADGDRDPAMSAIAVSPRVACMMHDMGLHEKYRMQDPTADAATAVRALSGQLARGDYARLLAGGMRDLEGHLVPLFGQLKPKADSGTTKFRPPQPTDMDPPHDTKAHPLLFRPGVLMTVSAENERQGHVLALCVIVSNRAFNFPEDHPDRVAFHPTPAFEESITFLYVVRAYDPPFSLRALGPPGILGRTGDRKSLDSPKEGRNTYDHVFRWAAHIEHRIGVFPTDDFRDGARSGFNDLKMSRESVRRFMPWGIATAHAKLVELRDEGALDETLVKGPMDSSRKCRHGDFGGACLRRAQLTEMLLQHTPLEPLLRGSADARDFGDAFLPVPVPEGPAGLHSRMKQFLAVA